MMNFECKVGDEVSVAHVSHRGRWPHSPRIGRVTKINGHGHIFVEVEGHNGKFEERFDKHGNPYKKSYGPRLVGAEWLRKELAERDRQQKLNTLAKAISTSLDERRTGYGDYILTEDDMVRLETYIAEVRALL